MLLPILILHVHLCSVSFTCVWIYLVLTGFTSEMSMHVPFPLFTCGIKRCPNIEYMYIQSLSRSCSVMSLVESGYVYQHNYVCMNVCLYLYRYVPTSSIGNFFVKWHLTLKKSARRYYPSITDASDAIPFHRHQKSITGVTVLVENYFSKKFFPPIFFAIFCEPIIFYPMCIGRNECIPIKRRKKTSPPFVWLPSSSFCQLDLDLTRDTPILYFCDNFSF
jgi:hypothetical protein